MTRREAVEPETNVTHVVDTDREGQTDSTGMFYWQTPRDFEDCLLVNFDHLMNAIKHIITIKCYKEGEVLFRARPFLPHVQRV